DLKHSIFSVIGDKETATDAAIDSKKPSFQGQEPPGESKDSKDPKNSRNPRRWELKCRCRPPKPHEVKDCFIYHPYKNTLAINIHPRRRGAAEKALRNAKFKRKVEDLQKKEWAKWLKDHPDTDPKLAPECIKESTN